MESTLGGPVLVETLPELVETRGIVHIIRGGVCCAAMPIDVFEAYMYAGMELVTAWRARDRKPGSVLPFKKR